MAAATQPPHSSIAGCRRQRCPSLARRAETRSRRCFRLARIRSPSSPPRVGSIPQASRSSCTGNRSDSGNRFAFFSRTRRRQWRRVFLAFSASAWQPVTTGLISPSVSCQDCTACRSLRRRGSVRRDGPAGSSPHSGIKGFTAVGADTGSGCTSGGVGGHFLSRSACPAARRLPPRRDCRAA